MASGEALHGCVPRRIEKTKHEKIEDGKGMNVSINEVAYRSHLFKISSNLSYVQRVAVTPRIASQ
jgi:hypothetical protein